MENHDRYQIGQSMPNVPYLEAMDLDQDSTDGLNLIDTSYIGDTTADYLSPYFSSFGSQPLNTSENSKKSPGSFFGKLHYGQSTSHQSSSSSKVRHSSEQSFCLVNVFDMRKNHFSNGEIINVNVQEQLVLHRIAQDYGVPENCLKSMQSGVSGERNPCVVAITENSENLTLFLRWEPGIGRKCVTVNCNATPNSLEADLEKFLIYKDFCGKYSPYCNHQKLDSIKNLTDQLVVSGHELLFREIKPVTLKCLYRSSPTADAIYYVNSYTTDTIDDVKLKVFNTIKKEPSNDEIRSLSSPEHIWLTSGNRLYTNREYIGSPARSDINNVSSGLSGLVDVVIHVQSLNCLPINVLYSECNETQQVDKIVISRSMSTAELRYKISTILHCPPNALKITINQKRVPEIDHISKFQELKEHCTITASIRQAITINVNLEDKPYTVSVMKLDLVLSVKQKLSDVTSHQKKHIKLIFEDKELNDHQQIEKAHLKDGSEVHAMHLPNRIRVCIRKYGKDLVHLIIDDSQKMKMKLLKGFYTKTIKLKPKYDINYHSIGQSVQFVDSESLASQGIEDGCRLYATESVNCHRMGSLTKIFDYKKDGQIHITYGAIIKGKLLKGTDDSGVSDDSSIEFDTQENQKEIPGIRLAHPEEIHVSTFSSKSDNSCEIEDLSNALVPLKLNISMPEYYPRSAISTGSPICFPKSQPHITVTPTLERHPFMFNSSNTVPVLGEPPGVVSDKDLDKLVSELSANVWQPFIRELLPDAEVTKQIESHKGNVSEQMFQCLKKWKQREGSKATKEVLQKALQSQQLNLLSFQIFGTEVQSDNTNIDMC